MSICWRGAPVWYGTVVEWRVYAEIAHHSGVRREWHGVSDSLARVTAPVVSRGRVRARAGALGQEGAGRSRMHARMAIRVLMRSRAHSCALPCPCLWQLVGTRHITHLARLGGAWCPLPIEACVIRPQPACRWPLVANPSLAQAYSRPPSACRLLPPRPVA